jgi:phytoene desaturase (3,4-didehydrolycopene-forming)
MSAKNMPRSVIIVGAGAGGVAAAARLAAAGLQVTVIEKNDYTGGRCSLIHRDGYVRCLSLGSQANANV